MERIWQPNCAWLPYADSYGVGPASIAIESARLLAANACTYVENNPDADNEAVVWQDSVFRQPAGPERTALVYEVARMVCVYQGAAVIERINTWARVTAKNPAGDVIWTTELRQPADSALSFGTLADSSSCPFPFPIEHPTGASSISIRWALRVQSIPYQQFDALPMLSGAPEQALPQGDRYPHVPGDWADMRYVWGSRGTEGNQWVVGGFSLIRLFAIVEAAVADEWDVEVGGRLTGFTQNAGPKGAALANVTRR